MVTEEILKDPVLILEASKLRSFGRRWGPILYCGESSTLPPGRCCRGCRGSGSGGGGGGGENAIGESAEKARRWGGSRDHDMDDLSTVVVELQTTSERYAQKVFKCRYEYLMAGSSRSSKTR